jgi:hypothetical protein
MSVDSFIDDEVGYANWLAGHPHGYVVNIQRSLNPSTARLHRRLPDRHRHAATRQHLDGRVHQALFRLG